mmetsp:Transcript_110350/g.312026  ORF Transcript_110350/g.312026 Transcript_110350/m.312026 type:complete len:237 (-) Transcript_110350:312-1022(-)
MLNHAPGSLNWPCASVSYQSWARTSIRLVPGRIRRALLRWAPCAPTSTSTSWILQTSSATSLKWISRHCIGLPARVAACLHMASSWSRFLILRGVGLWAKATTNGCASAEADTCICAAAASEGQWLATTAAWSLFQASPPSVARKSSDGPTLQPLQPKISLKQSGCESSADAETAAKLSTGTPALSSNLQKEGSSSPCGTATAIGVPRKSGLAATQCTQGIMTFPRVSQKLNGHML